MDEPKPPMHPLLAIMNAAAEGSFPAVDGVVEVMPLLEGSSHIYILELTGHAYVMTDRTQRELEAAGADGFGGVMHPNVLNFLAGTHIPTTQKISSLPTSQSAAQIGCHDALLVAKGTGAPGLLAAGAHIHGPLPHRTDLEDHPRVGYAKVRRRHVQVYGDARGLVTLGRGIADRWEISVEVDPTNRGAGNARALINEALGHIPSDQWCYGEVSPGNAASLRAFLAAGWIPIGAEIIIIP
jgi:GNAT superfamily N-acetyltransferase